MLQCYCLVIFRNHHFSSASSTIHIVQVKAELKQIFKKHHHIELKHIIKKHRHIEIWRCFLIMCFNSGLTVYFSKRQSTFRAMAHSIMALARRVVHLYRAKRLKSLTALANIRRNTIYQVWAAVHPKARYV